MVKLISSIFVLLIALFLFLNALAVLWSSLFGIVLVMSIGGMLI